MKDTLTTDLIEAQVALTQELFAQSIMDPIMAMNVAKKYKEPAQRASPCATLLQMILSYDTGWSMAGVPEHAQEYNRLLDVT